MTERLLEELVPGRPWPIMLCGLLLSRTKRAVAEPMLLAILKRWPTHKHASRDWDPSWLLETLRPGGFYSVRAATIGNWVAHFTAHGEPRTRQDAESLLGVGPYIADCFSLFVERDFDHRPSSGDGPLTRYWERNSFTM